MEDLNQLRPEQESGAKKPAPDDVDALLQDVKSLLGETDADIAAEAPAEPDAEILAQLPNGTPVTVLGNFDTWYTVRADTLYGFAPITEVQLAVMPLTEE